MILLVLGTLLTWLLVALGGWLVYQVLRQNGRILLRLEALERELARPGPQPPTAPGPSPGLPVGAPAPEFQLANLAGSRKRISDWRGRRVLLIFFNPRCGFCTQMLPDLAALPIDPAGGRPLPVVITTGSAEENRGLVEDHGLRCPVLLQEEGEVASRYQAAGTPMGYLLDEEGRIASDLAVGAEAVLALAGIQGRAADGKAVPVSAAPVRNGRTRHSGNRSLSESRLNRTGLPAGTPAPSFRVPRLDGRELSLEEYRGRRVLLVFSDPHCGPCDALLPQLQQAVLSVKHSASGVKGRISRPNRQSSTLLNARRSTLNADLQVLLVSRGDPEANRRKIAQFGLTFPVGLQRQWEVSKRYAMFATPIAYLIDPQGMIAADVAVGVEPILGLLTSAGRSASPAGRSAPGREVVPV
jgi:peroxiredoxin